MKGYRISTADFLILTSVDQLPLVLKINVFLFFKTSNLNVEVNCSESSPSVRVPGLDHRESSGATTLSIKTERHYRYTDIQRKREKERGFIKYKQIIYRIDNF
jgi:hypothetical protein